ncbi:MAG: T9SS type A sorting domain-containing protein [Chitinophagaceae bacterium]|jgi:hypothetical protein
MKKLLLFLGLASTLSVQAQTSTLKVLIDSLPNEGWDIIESFDNKLYTLPAHIGGKVSEVNTSTGALTHVATLPALGTSQNYATYSGNFLFLKGKTVATIFNAAGGESYHIAAGLSTVDTLLKNHMAFSSIFNVDTSVFILTTPNGLTAQRLYATNLVSPVVLLDTNVHNNGGADNQIMQCHSQKRIYYVIRNASNTDYILKSSNGSTKITIETLSGFASGYGFSLLGEIGADMYFTSYHRSSLKDTTWIKKCDVNGVVTVVDTILRNSSFPGNGGLVLNANKLIIPFYGRLVVYDLTTKTKEDLFIGKNVRTYNWTQDFVAKTHFYANVSSSTDTTYISDGTVAGTLKYSTAAGEPLGGRFETYSDYQSLGNKAIICDEFPIANRADELYVGNATNAALYKLYADRKSFPSHFEKVDGALFFTIIDNSKKVKVMKLEGCDLPTTNPLGIKNDLKSKDFECTVYPNPNNGVFTIETSSFSNESSIEVYNILGQLVHNQTTVTTSNLIDISNHASGVYFVKITTSGEPVFTQKIIKQ